tara:strand:- start:292 stop:525 length:234 start_codon:yes stop_codon:yes gene_type:complete
MKLFEEGLGDDPAPPAPTTIEYEPGLGFTGLDELYCTAPAPPPPALTCPPPPPPPTARISTVLIGLVIANVPELVNV